MWHRFSPSTVSFRHLLLTAYLHAIVLTAAGCFLFTPPVFAAGVTSMDVSPTSGQTSIKVTLGGHNAPNQPLSVWIAPDSNPNNLFQLMAAVAPSQDGDWNAQVYMPRSWPSYQVVPGKYIFTVRTDDNSYTSQATFTVLPVASPFLSASPSPPPSHVGVAEAIVGKLAAQNPLLPSVALILLLVGLIFAINKVGKSG